MKKTSLFLLLFLVFFFASISNVNAYSKNDIYGKSIKYEEFIKDVSYCGETVNEGGDGKRGTYTYDINSITVVNGNLTIEGWGVLNDEQGNNKINNIEPEFMLTLEGYNAPDPNDADKLGSYVGSMNYENKAIWRPYSSSTATPNDYTEYYFNSTSCSSPYRLYGATGKRASDTDGNALCYKDRFGNPIGNPNYLYINLNFKFSIPLSKIKENFADAGANRIYMRLSISTAAGKKTVYGNNKVETVKHRERCIPISLQDSRIDNGTKNELKKYSVANIKGSVSKVTIMVLDSRPRATTVYFGDWWYMKTSPQLGTTLVKGAATNDPSNGMSFVHFIQNSSYELIDKATPIGNYINQTITYVYPVGIKLQELRGRYTGYVIDIDRSEKAKAAVAYIPAMWAKPYLSGKGTFFEIEQSCKFNIECSSKSVLDTDKTKCPSTKNPNTPGTKAADDCCDQICKSGSGNTDTYFCKNICKTSCTVNKECNSKTVLDTNKTKCPSTKNPNTPGTKAADDCCDQICKSGSGYEGTYYCTNICKTPVVPKDCNTIIDPQEKFCCLYKDKNSEASEICAIYDDVDDSSSRKNKCAADTTIENTFKYPANGYGDYKVNGNKLTNEACKISCEEIIKTTFQPNQLVRAGMGYAYPIQINGTRYCTAEYTNETWKNSILTEGGKANTQYKNMTDALDSAKKEDEKCGSLTYQTKSPSTNCASDETLNTSNSTCEKVVSYDNSCSDGSYNSSTGKCEKPGQDCSASYSATYNKTTKKYSCPNGGTLKGTTCDKCKPITITTGNPTKCLSGTDTGSGCRLSHSACDSPYSLQGSICKKPICSKSGEDWGTAQSRINGYLAAASNSKLAYTTAVNRFNDLMRDRSICDNYPTSNSYKGSNNIGIKYNEVDTYGNSEKTQVSNQTDYIITVPNIGGSNFIGTNARTSVSYDIMKDKNKRLDISSNGHNRDKISSYSGDYSDYYADKATYFDFWNEQSTASNKLEFSKNYYVQRYTGDLSTTSQSGYDAGGRLVYTDFYQMSRTQNFVLDINNLGPNLPNSSNRSINLNPFTCLYKINNLIFPPKGDPNNDKYGNVAFNFRQISLTDPFPNRDPRENWMGRQSLITSKGYNVYTTQTPVYQYYLDPTRMQTIRAYNSTHNYGSYDINNPYNSIFLNNVVRGW